MFDLFLEEDPWIKERIAEGILKGRAEGRARGLAEGRAEGIIQSSRQLLVIVVQTRFPSLGEVAELTAAQLADYDVLQALIEQIIRATGEHEARQMLERQTASQKPQKQP